MVFPEYSGPTRRSKKVPPRDHVLNQGLWRNLGKKNVLGYVPSCWSLPVRVLKEHDIMFSIIEFLNFILDLLSKNFISPIISIPAFRCFPIKGVRNFSFLTKKLADSDVSFEISDKAINSLPHRNDQDLVIEEYFIPKDSFIQGLRKNWRLKSYGKLKIILGCLTAVMFDPDNFENPLDFCAERFLKDGAFRNDPRVCIFSLGLRDCIAKKFAKE